MDDLTKQKILQFEYVDFSKLLPHDRVLQEEDQRLTIINKGGVSYLVPLGETLSGIHGYGKWDQAFRVYSDIITSRFPSKAQELIQYNHIIHTASQTYVWDNVYMYDKDFRIHISRNPTRSWVIILQQAWAMRLKDRLSGRQVRNYPEDGRSKDYCRRFQRGKCHLGASCKFEHQCSICGKFGHGAHICRHRNFDQDDKNSKSHSSSDKPEWDRSGNSHQGGGSHQRNYHKDQKIERK